MKSLYTENYKTLMKEIEDTINGEISFDHGLEELILLKCPYYPKWSTESLQSVVQKNKIGTLSYIIHKTQMD